MAQRGRRQVLQLDDVSSTHSPIRPRAFVPVANEEVVQTKTSSNPLLSLVGYASDDSSDEDSDSDSNNKTEDHPPAPPSSSSSSSTSSSSSSSNSSSSANSTRENHAIGSEKGQPMLEIPLPEDAEPVKGLEPSKSSEPQEGGAEAERCKAAALESGPEFETVPVAAAVESMLDIPLPESCGPPPLPPPPQPTEPKQGAGVGMESELANFFAEIQQIESISAETAPPPPDNDNEEAAGLPTTTPDLPSTGAGSPAATTVDSSQPPEPSGVDLGFIPRPDASIPLPEESKPAAPVVEEKPKSTPSNAYRSMFVKGAPEFVRKEKEEEKKENGMEVEEELPEEPVSEWQMVQDEGTGYYYYWNMVTNTVTWEIPPGYTQFLLLYKEYQERIAAIPEDKLSRMKERKKQKEKESSARESSPAPSSSKPKKDKKHKKDKHRKEKSEPAALIGPQLPPTEPAVTIGPQLPPMHPDASTTEAKASADQSDAGTNEIRKAVSPRPSSEDGREGKNGEAVDSAVDSTSLTLPEDVEAIFDEALSAVSESHVDSKKADTKKATDSRKAHSKRKADSKKAHSKKAADTSIDMFQPDEPPAEVMMVDKSASGPPAVTSSSVVEPSSLAPAPSVDVTTSVDSSKSVSADSSKSGSPAPAESDSATMAPAVTVSAATAAGAGANTSVVSSSSVVPSILLTSKESRDTRTESGEGVVTNSGVKEGAGRVEGEDEDEEDLDMDFDDIDDLDRALEKALEKKLEKKKAELEKLQNGSEEDMVTSDGQPLTSSSLPAHSDASEQMMMDMAPAEADSAVSSSVRNTELRSPKARSSFSAAGENAADSSEVKSESTRPKRSAAESSTKEEGSRGQEPVAKKARLVAYDAAETDEESLDASEEVSTTPGQSVKSSGDVNSLAEGQPAPAPAPEPAVNLAEIEDMASTACAKLAFLEVTVEGLTPLQTSLIALQTRMTDWQQGGLSGAYFHQRLREVNDLLTHYERRAVPAGWSCQWDRYEMFILSVVFFLLFTRSSSSTCHHLFCVLHHHHHWAAGFLTDTLRVWTSEPHTHPP